MSGVPSAFILLLVAILVATFFELAWAVEPIMPVFDVMVCVVVAGACDILVAVIFDELTMPVAGTAV